MLQKVLFDVVQGKIGLVKFMVTVVAEPEQSIINVHIRTFAFNHQTDATLVAYWGMRHFGWMQVHIARS